MLVKLLVDKLKKAEQLKESIHNLDKRLANIMLLYTTVESTRIEMLKELTKFESELEGFYIENIEKRGG